MKKEKEVDTAVVVKSIWQDAKPHERKLLKITSIKSQEDFDLVATHLKNIKAYGKIAVDKKEGIINPIKRAIEKINALFEPFLNWVDETEKTYKQMMLEWENAKEAQKKTLTAQLQTGKIKNLSTYTRKMEALSSTSTNSSTRTNKKAVVTDLKKLPREYMVPDMKLIAKDLKAGKIIPGAELQDVKVIAI